MKMKNILVPSIAILMVGYVILYFTRNKLRYSWAPCA